MLRHRVNASNAGQARGGGNTLCVTIGEILRAFARTECATGYAQKIITF
jgi:hypothetical protein